MYIEIKIGREVEGASAFRVSSAFKKVSRRHATLHWHDGSVTIEDNESANGTFVNGKRIAKTKIKEGDTVWLGGNGTDKECYQLDVKKVFESCREAENAQRTDYTKEFALIKQAYINYKAEEAELRKQTTVKSQRPIRIISIIPTFIGAIIAVIPGADPGLRIAAISVGGAITGLVNIMMTGKNVGVNDNLNEQITELQIKYQKDYRCPKCGKDFNLSTHWKKLEAGGKCPYGCGAEFVK